MSNGIDTEKCTLCPYVTEAFEEDGPEGFSRANADICDHLEKVHGLNEQDVTKARVIALVMEEEEGSSIEDIRTCLAGGEVEEDDYERLTGHKLYCTAGFTSTCQCGARPDLAEQKPS